MKILKIIFFLPIRLLLLVSRPMSLTCVFPSFWRALLASAEYGAAMKAYDAGKYEDAFNMLKTLADIDPKAISPPETSVVACSQYYLAFMFLHGEGVQVDNKVALNYMRKAAEIGHDEAIEFLKKYEAQPNQPPEPIR